MIGLFYGLTELPLVYLHIDGIVELGMAQEDKIVDGDYALDAAATDAYGQLARKSVIELYAIALKIGYDAATAPIGLEVARGGVDEGNVGAIDDLGAQVIAATVGGIEVEAQGILGQIVDQCAAVRAQTCAVANYALGIDTYIKWGCSHDLREKCLNTKRTMTKFVGTAIINTANGASRR